ncbi:hypothetical protein CEK28_08980 [Xenophilus sp. AP218F]|nr:hypothetical protein CEK28_08980 [Xenophilus sp. AP218F]
MVNRRHAGVTLLEVALALTLIATLALLSVPLTRNFNEAARLQLSRHLLEEGYARAQSQALRNPAGKARDEAAAVLVAADGGALCLYPDAAQARADCSGAPLWRAASPIAPALAVCDAAAPPPCLALDPAGLPAPAALAAKPCAAAPDYCIKGNADHVSGTL